MTKNLQDGFLAQLQEEHAPVTAITTNGFQMKGRIAGYDKYTILIEINGRQHLVFKSAVSTIVKGE